MLPALARAGGLAPPRMAALGRRQQHALPCGGRTGKALLGSISPSELSGEASRHIAQRTHPGLAWHIAPASPQT